MDVKILILTSLIFLLEQFFPSPTYALDSPLQVSPSDGSTVTDINLNWQVPPYPLYSNNHYRIQVDNKTDFSSPEKDYYPPGNSYSPQGMDQGTWYWRLKAKGENGTWSDWSSTWSFNLLLSPTTATPTATQLTTPTPTSTATPKPTSTPTPTPSPTKIPSLFAFSAPPVQINSDQSFTTTVNLTGLSPTAGYFLKGVFFKIDSTNYFGQTKIGPAWVKNSQNCTSQFLITTDISGSWTGDLEIMPDSGDSGFTGSGDYLFKIGRYGASCSSLTWSNTADVYIADNTPTSTPAPTPASAVKPTLSPTPTLSPSLISFLTPESTGDASVSSLLRLPLNLTTTISSVAGVSTHTQSVFDSGLKTSDENHTFSPLLILGIFFLALSSALLIFEQNPALPQKLKSSKIALWFMKQTLPKRLKRWGVTWRKKLPAEGSWRLLVHWAQAKLPLFRGLPKD